MPKSIHRPEYQVIRVMLRDMRIAAGVTQVDLSAALGRTQSFVSDIERGTRRLDLLELRDICQLVGVSFPDAAAELERRLESQSLSRTGKQKK